MSGIPKDKALDSTIALLREGYLFISNRCHRYRSDLFQTRLMLQPAICMSGEEAARIFYDGERFERKAAIPRRVQKTLVGSGGVQMLDDEAHHHRKAMFMTLMTPEPIGRLLGLIEDQWRSALASWEKKPEIVLFSETQDILLRAVCQWAAVPYREDEVRMRADDMGALVYAFGAVGPRHWQGRKARRRSEQWIGRIIEDMRNGKIQAAETSALAVVARHRQLNGEWLDRKVAAVELINIIRPIVAIATYITFTALALHAYPEWRARLQGRGEDALEMFVQEVRRFYPFTPFVGARVRHAFDWRGCHFPKGRLVLLDAYGTDHDARRWEEPDRFKPERFERWQENAFDFIPQGGGSHHTGHRCAGERITIEVMKQALSFLVNRLDYDVPAQDLHIPLRQIPTLPKSGFVMRHVKARTAVSASATSSH